MSCAASLALELSWNCPRCQWHSLMRYVKIEYFVAVTKHNEIMKCMYKIVVYYNVSDLLHVVSRKMKFSKSAID